MKDGETRDGATGKRVGKIGGVRVPPWLSQQALFSCGCVTQLSIAAYSPFPVMHKLFFLPPTPSSNIETSVAQSASNPFTHHIIKTVNASLMHPFIIMFHPFLFFLNFTLIFLQLLSIRQLLTIPSRTLVAHAVLNGTRAFTDHSTNFSTKN